MVRGEWSVRLSSMLLAAAASSAGVGAAVRSNPLVVQKQDGQIVESCADPTVIRGQQAGDNAWYMYCTADPLNDTDKDGSGNWNYHLVPVFRSYDLVHWTYMGDAFATRPTWAESWSNLWAPEIRFFDGKYYLYYSATDTKYSLSGERFCDQDSAVGVGTATSPTGPFTHAASPVIHPRRNGTGCDFKATIDPDVITDPSGQNWIYYGSFKGGIEVRKLSSDALVSNPTSATLVAAWDKFEAAEVMQRDGYYYLLVSAAGCCDGPKSGYSVFVGRSTSPTGPFSDEEGISLLAGRTGGTPVLSFTGNRWIGPGHNTTATDLAGQDWMIYHAIDLGDPYFAGSVGFTKRPPLLDPIDWVDGWPTVRGAWWVSDCAQPSPVWEAGGTPDYHATYRENDRPGSLLPDVSDEFDGSALGPQWSWIRQPAAGTHGLDGVAFRFDTQSGDLNGSQNNASVLVEAAPQEDFVVETRLRHTVPPDGCCHNYTQAGLVVYGGDDDYIKLVHVAIWGTRQTEFAKEESPVPAGYPTYGGTRAGPPGEWTWLRIARRQVYGGEQYSAYSSLDGTIWRRGGTWFHSLGAGAKIGLVSMSGAGYSAYFDFVRVSRLASADCSDPALADPCDTNGDGTGDFCDPDDDADLLPDLEDCAATDLAQGRPAEVPALSVGGAEPSTISWESATRADAYDVSRGLIPSFATGDYGACFANDLASTSTQDDEPLAPGNAFFYLARGVDSGCGGAGSYGRTGAGADRGNTNAAACP